MKPRTSKQVEYTYMLKESEYKERKTVDRWFYNYCVAYRKLCESLGGTK